MERTIIASPYNSACMMQRTHCGRWLGEYFFARNCELWYVLLLCPVWCDIVSPGCLQISLTCTWLFWVLRASGTVAIDAHSLVQFNLKCHFSDRIICVFCRLVSHSGLGAVTSLQNAGTFHRDAFSLRLLRHSQAQATASS